MILLTHSTRLLQETGNTSFRWIYKLGLYIPVMQLRQDRSVHVGEILLVPSPDEGGGHQGNETLIMDRSNDKKCKSQGKKKQKTKIDQKNRKRNNANLRKKKKKNWPKKEKKKCWGNTTEEKRNKETKKKTKIGNQTWSRNYQNGKTKTCGGSDPFFSYILILCCEMLFLGQIEHCYLRSFLCWSIAFLHMSHEISYRWRNENTRS